MVWVIYSNNQSSAPAPAPAPGSSEFDNAASAATDIMAKIKNNGGFDLTIFSSEKYKALQKNVVIPEGQSAPAAGKADPFKPN